MGRRRFEMADGPAQGRGAADGAPLTSDDFSAGAVPIGGRALDRRGRLRRRHPRRPATRTRLHRQLFLDVSLFARARPLAPARVHRAVGLATRRCRAGGFRRRTSVVRSCQRPWDRRAAAARSSAKSPGLLHAATPRWRVRVRQGRQSPRSDDPRAAQPVESLALVSGVSTELELTAPSSGASIPKRLSEYRR